MATVAGTKRLLDISGNNISTAVSLEAEGTLVDSDGDSGIPGQILSSTGSGINWINNAAGDITGVTAGTGMTGGGTSGTVTLNVIGGSGITANANDIAVDTTVVRTTTNQSIAGIKSFSGKIGADGGIDGLTLANGGITGSNYDISGVNQLTINDPGEGIVFTGTNSVGLFTIDDATDSILKITNASALQVNAKITNLSNPTDAGDAANKTYVDNAIAGVPQGDITAVTAGTGMTGGGTSGAVTLNVIGGSGVTANANDIAVDATVVRTTGNQTIAGVKTFSDDIRFNNDILDSNGSTGTVGQVLVATQQGAVSWATQSNSFITAATFSTSTGVITGTGGGSAGFTVDIDGRYPIGNTANQPFFLDLQQNTVGTTYGDGVATVPSYYFGQRAGDNDGMRFYAESAASNDVTAVWEIIDDVETGLSWLFRNKKTYSPYTATDAMKIDGDGDVTIGKDLTITGGDIILSGTGRIQGIDTVTSATDAASKGYVDAAVGGIPVGDITAVTAGSGMTGGGTTGAVTLNVIGGTGITANANDIAIDATVVTLTGSQELTNKTGSNSQWTNDAGYTTNIGDITSVTAGTGLTGGGTSGAVTLNVIGGSGITANANDITVDSTVLRTSGAQSISGAKSFSEHVTIEGTTKNLYIINDAETKAGIVFGDTQAGTGQRAAIKFDSSAETLDFFVNDEADERMSISTAGTLVLNSGQFILSGTGRIQGIDTVTSATDAASKGYVDSAVAGVPQGDITAVTAGNGLTGGGTSGAVTLNVVGGTGITANANDIAIDATVATLAGTQTFTGTKTINTLKIGTANKIQFANNDFIRYDDANGVGRFHFDSDGGTNNASVQAATFVGALAGNATTATNATQASKIKAGGTGPSTEDLNSVANSISVGQLEYRGYNSSSTNKPPANDNANGVITVGQHNGNYNAQVAFSSDGNMYWRDNPGSTNGSWRKMWDAGNDGTGSGLDADKLDGQEGSYYYPASNPNGYTSNTGDITGVSAGNGLTGGGSSGSVTLNVVGGSGITANANDIAVDATVVRTTGAQTIAGAKTFSDDVRFNDDVLDYQGNAGTAGQVLVATGQGAVSWATQSEGVESVTPGAGLTGGGSSSSITVSANYAASSSNLIQSATQVTTVTDKSYTPYILISDSNPGVNNGAVQKIRLENINLDRFGNTLAVNKTIKLSRSTLNSTINSSPIYIDNTNSSYGEAYNYDSDVSSQYGSRHMGFRYNGTVRGSISQSGTTSVAFNTTNSDERLKKNIETWDENILEKFEKIKPKKFNFLDDKVDEEKTKGYIAQEMVESFPEAYPTDFSEENYYNYNPSGMVVYLTKAIKELIEKNKQLESRIQTLENN